MPLNLQGRKPKVLDPLAVMQRHPRRKKRTPQLQMKMQTQIQTLPVPTSSIQRNEFEVEGKSLEIEAGTPVDTSRITTMLRTGTTMATAHVVSM